MTRTWQQMLEWALANHDLARETSDEPALDAQFRTAHDRAVALLRANGIDYDAALAQMKGGGP